MANEMQTQSRNDAVYRIYESDIFQLNEIECTFVHLDWIEWPKEEMKKKINESNLLMSLAKWYRTCDVCTSNFALKIHNSCFISAIYCYKIAPFQIKRRKIAEDGNQIATANDVFAASSRGNWNWTVSLMPFPLHEPMPRSCIATINL